MYISTAMAKYVDLKKHQAQWAQSRKQERDQFKV